MLRIARFVTRCQASRNGQEVRALAESIARENLAVELGAHLGQSLAPRGDTVHIRRLRLRLHVRGAIDRRRLTDAWIRALTRQLFTALAYPHGGGHFQVERSPSAAHFRAALIRDLLSGAAAGKWYYRRHASLLAQPRATAVLAILREAPGEMGSLLEALAQVDSLEPALAILDDLVLEEIFRALALDHPDASGPPHELLAQAARVLTRHPPSRGLRLDSRVQALRMYTLARGTEARLGPRDWLAVLRALALFAEHGELWSGSGRGAATIAGHALPPGVETLVQAIRCALAAPAGGTTTAGEAALTEALRAAGLQPPDRTVTEPEAEPWRDVDGASLFLLTAPLLHLGWARDWTGPAGEAAIYALACAVRGTFDPTVAAIDPCAALFAGMFGEPSAVSLRHFLTLPPPPETAATWAGAMDLLAGRLIAYWTERLPGFRRASRAAVVRQFLLSAGRVRISRERVLVSLNSNPAFLAIKIASLDQAVEHVPWLDGRRLEIRLENL